MKVMTLIQLSLCLLVGLPYSAAIANTESENHAQIVAKEIAALQSLKYGLDLQVSQLRKAHEVKMSLKNSQLQKLESELARLHVEVDEAQSRFDENEKK